MKKHLAKLLSGFLAACLMAGSALAAEITPSVSSIQLEKEQTTFSFDIKLHADAAFAGAEFGLKPSASDVSFHSLEMLGSLEEEPQTKTVKDGVLYFCFYSSSNKYQPGDYTVARVTYAYSGTAARNVQLVSSKIVTVDANGQTSGDTSTPAFTVSITRAGSSESGGGTGGGGGGSSSGGGSTGGSTTPAQPGSGTFVDVPDGSFCRDAVEWAVDHGITNGITDQYFDPNGVCTRAQAVTFLWRAAGKPAPQNREMLFTDVPSNAYYHDAVLWAVEQGITRGTTETTFSPNQRCSRGHIVTFLYRAQNSPPALGTNPFSDVSYGSFCYHAALWAAANGVTKGTTETTFSPSAPCTRGQIVTFLYRCLAQ
mgnify:FL=1